MGGSQERGIPKELKRRDQITKPHDVITSSAKGLIERAKEDAFQRVVNLTSEKQERVNNAIKNQLLPYILESEVIAQQLDSERHTEFTQRTDEFLGAGVVLIVCPDGRILFIQLADPLVANIYRKLQGFPPLRQSTKGESNRVVPNDPWLSSSIENALEIRKIQYQQSGKIVTFLGPHIHSVHPNNEGCGDLTNELITKGQTQEIAMLQGGLKEYYSKLGHDGFYAFDNIVENAGGRGTTFDLVHDAHSQGFILGLRKAHESFDTNLTLRQNLEFLEQNKMILMTEKLKPIFYDRIVEEAAKKNISLPINMRNYYNFANNAILIGNIARELTEQEETNEFSFIPRTIKKDKTEIALRVAAYHCIRNVVYRVLGGITPGKHDLARHPEKLIRVGPIGADFNVENIPFIESTVPGLFQTSDIDAATKLYNISYKVLKEQSVNLIKEARIILVTGIYDPSMYDKNNPEIARKELTLISHIVQNNAAWIRERLTDGVTTAQTVVIGALHEPGTRRLTHIV